MPDLVDKGINYDTGTNYVVGSLSRPTLPADTVRRDMTVLRDDLHCNSVNVFGTDIGRLVATAQVGSIRVRRDPELLRSFLAGTGLTL